MRQNSTKLFRGKLPSQIKTVEDLLTKSDVNDTIDVYMKHKTDTENIIIIYQKRDKRINWIANNEVTNERLLWMLKSAEYSILNDDTDEED